MMYLFYARGGKEFEVADKIRDKGHHVECPPKMEFVRRGKKRRPEPKVSPVLPNYLFARVPAEAYLDVMTIKHLASTATPLSEADIRALTRFVADAAREYAAAEKIRHNQEMISEYRAGQALQALDGRFSDKLLTFRAMVERPYDMYPKVRAEVEMMGRMTVVELDPLSVKAAE